MTEIYDLAARAEDVLLEIVWDQWAEVGLPVPHAGRRPKRSVVDPEALLLLSASLIGTDDRLRNAVAWWAQTCAPLTSVQRIKRLASIFPEVALKSLSFGAAQAASLHDPRWTTLVPANAGSSDLPGAAPQKRELRILSPAALVFRSRLLFGVNPRADIITYLLGRGTQATRIQSIVATTCYARSTVSQILSQLVRARLLLRSEDHPSTFKLCAEAWREVYGKDVIRNNITERLGFRRDYSRKTAAPMWLCWPQVFVYLLSLHQVGGEVRLSPEDYRGRLAEVRRIHEAFRRTMMDHRIRMQALYGYHPRTLEALDESIDDIRIWYQKHA